jgi:antitoxin component YwqK of YwqJK toxin-antitoxin module
MLNKTGIWTYYNENGDILLQIQYKDGIKTVLKEARPPASTKK